MTPQERRLAAQLSDAQFARSTAEAQLLQAAQQRDQTEAILRQARVDLDQAVTYIAASPAPSSTTSPEQAEQYQSFRERYPNKFNNAE